NAIGESALSNERSVSPASVPNAPVLAAPVVGNGAASLSWAAPSSGGSSITGYKIDRGTSSGTETLLATVGGETTTFTNINLANGTTYFYTVSAVNAIGEGALSNEQSATPHVPDTTPPSKPTGLKLAVAGANQLALDWA